MSFLHWLSPLESSVDTPFQYFVRWNRGPSAALSILKFNYVSFLIPLVSFLSQYPWWQAHPLNAPTALKQRAVLMDDIWHGAGDRSTDMDWYTKRALLGGVYTATELYMLTDFSAGWTSTSLSFQQGQSLWVQNPFWYFRYLGTLYTRAWGSEILNLSLVKMLRPSHFTLH